MPGLTPTEHILHRTFLKKGTETLSSKKSDKGLHGHMDRFRGQLKLFRLWSFFSWSYLSKKKLEEVSRLQKVETLILLLLLSELCVDLRLQLIFNVDSRRLYMFLFVYVCISLYMYVTLYCKVHSL